jgi:formate hydrogenlyase subunit 4
MQKYLDTILVGVLAFVVVVIFLAIRPGYTPVEVSEEAITLTEGEINIEGEAIIELEPDETTE